jgi:hypothetical protein
MAASRRRREPVATTEGASGGRGEQSGWERHGAETDGEEREHG